MLLIYTYDGRCMLIATMLALCVCVNSGILDAPGRRVSVTVDRENFGVV